MYCSLFLVKNVHCNYAWVGAVETTYHQNQLLPEPACSDTQTDWKCINRPMVDWGRGGYSEKTNKSSVELSYRRYHFTLWYVHEHNTHSSCCSMVVAVHSKVYITTSKLVSASHPMSKYWFIFERQTLKCSQTLLNNSMTSAIQSDNPATEPLVSWLTAAECRIWTLIWYAQILLW